MDDKKLSEVIEKHFENNKDWEQGVPSAVFIHQFYPIVLKVLYVIVALIVGLLLYLKIIRGNEDVMYYIYILLPVIVYIPFTPKIIARSMPLTQIVEGRVVIYLPREITLQSFKVLKPRFRYRMMGYFVTSPELPNGMYLNARPLFWIHRKGFWVTTSNPADRKLVEQILAIEENNRVMIEQLDERNNNVL